MGKILSNLLKIALGAGVVYTAYKVGQSNGENKESDLFQKVKEDLEFEIDFISNLIKEHQDEPNKTQKNIDDINTLSEDLNKLKSKLEELKNRK
jgi:peptidoglycan hydrolase CwlO-like protein